MKTTSVNPSFVNDRRSQFTGYSSKVIKINLKCPFNKLLTKHIKPEAQIA